MKYICHICDKQLEQNKHELIANWNSWSCLDSGAGRHFYIAADSKAIRAYSVTVYDAPSLPENSKYRITGFRNNEFTKLFIVKKGNKHNCLITVPFISLEFVDGKPAVEPLFHKLKSLLVFA